MAFFFKKLSKTFTNNSVLSL